VKDLARVGEDPAIPFVPILPFGRKIMPHGETEDLR
jgi:hypothetical protein